jgi:ParB family chromosome partitioning protein
VHKKFPLKDSSVRERLRQGAEALLARSAHEIALDKIELDPQQPRKTRDPQRAAELADSVRAQGVLSPLLVTQIPGTDRYRIVFGERRYHAAQEAGIQNVPCVVREQLDPLQILVIQLTENLQREDPRPVEVAASIARLEDKGEFGLSRSEIARLLGRSPSWVTNMLSLLSTTGAAREALDENLVRDAETTRLFQQLPQTEQDALLAEARSSNLPIRRSAVRRRLALVPGEPESTPTSAAEEASPIPPALAPGLDEGASRLPGHRPPAGPERSSESEPTPPEEQPRRRGRPSQPRQRLLQLPSLSWEELGRLFELLDLEPPSDPSELSEAFERLRDALR